MTTKADDYTTVRLRKSTLARLRGELARIEERLSHDYPGDCRLREIGTHETAFTNGEERRSVDAFLNWLMLQVEDKRRRSRESSYRRRDRQRAAHRPVSAPLPEGGA